MRQKMKRMMGILLSLVMVLGLIPGMSLTAYAATEAYTELKNDNTVVQFNNYNWYIIADYSTAVDAGTVTLLAADTSFGTSKFHDSSNAYSGSTVKGVLDALTAEGGAFASVKDAIVDTDLTDVGVTGAKLYLLSENDLSTSEVGPYADFNFTGAEYGGWWLRSPGSYDDYADFVYGERGNMYSVGTDVKKELGVRPALKLDLSKVIFSSETKTFSLSVTGVTLNPSTEQKTTVGDKVPFTASIEPTGALKMVKWSANSGAVKLYSDSNCTTEVGSAATDKLTVYAKGITAGTATVTVTATNGTDDTADDKSANCNVTVHAHNFIYAAGTGENANTITATCSADGCTLPESSAGPGDHVATLTISANGGTYDGTTAYGATITDANSIQGDAKVQYQKKTDGSYGTATETVPTDAGDYKASITVGGATASVEYTIAQADPTANAPTGLTATYGQTLADVSLEGKNPEGNTPGTWAWTDSTKSVGNVVTPAASFKATFTPDSSNYKTVENVNVTVTVGKAYPTAPTGLNATYGQTLENVTLPDGWTWADSKKSVGNVVDPAASFKANFAGDDNHNAASNVNVTVTVGKANAVVAAVTANSPTYDGTEKQLVSVDDSDLAGGTMYYAVSKVTDPSNPPSAPDFDGDSQSADKKWSTSIPTVVDAGTYYVWYMVKGDDNHNDTAVCQTPVAVAISKADAPNASIAWEKKYLYSRDNEDGFTLTGLPTDCGTVIWKTPTTSGSLEYTTAPAVSDAGVLSYIVQQSGTADQTGTVTVVAQTQNYNDVTFTIGVTLIDKIPVKLKTGSSVTLKNSTSTLT
nr:DUF6273 domain-containing protein [Lachnospiraceae bacterium]